MCGSWRCAVFLLLGSLTLCACWAPAPYWRVLCASGTPNSSRWAVSLSLFGNTLCDGDALHGSTMLTSDGGRSRCDGIHVSLAGLETEKPKRLFGYGYYKKDGNVFVGPGKWRAEWRWSGWQFYRLEDNLMKKIYLKSSFTLSDIFGVFEAYNKKRTRLDRLSLSIVCRDSRASQKLLTKASFGEDNSFTWTSQADSSQAGSAWLGTRFRAPVDASCVKLLQLKGMACADVVLQSSSDGFTWFGEAGQVYTEVAPDEVVTSLVMAGGGAMAGMSCPKNTSCTVHDLRRVHDQPWSFSLLWTTVSLGVSSLLVICCCVPVSCGRLLPHDSHRSYRCDFSSARVQGKLFSPQEEPEAESSSIPNKKILKLTLVRHPGWFLKGTSLSEILRANCIANSIVEVVSEKEALSSFPCFCFRRLGVVAAFEAVVRVPAGYTSEEIGRMIHAALGQREQKCGRRLPTSGDQPSVQLSVCVRHTFLHFGGSIGCLHGRRWQSCPPRQHHRE